MDSNFVRDTEHSSPRGTTSRDVKRTWRPTMLQAIACRMQSHHGSPRRTRWQASERGRRRIRDVAFARHRHRSRRRGGARTVIPVRSQNTECRSVGATVTRRSTSRIALDNAYRRVSATERRTCLRRPCDGAPMVSATRSRPSTTGTRRSRDSSVHVLANERCCSQRHCGTLCNCAVLRTAPFTANL